MPFNIFGKGSKPKKNGGKMPKKPAKPRKLPISIKVIDKRKKREHEELDFLFKD